MSGGHFSYVQYRLNDIIESIENTIKNNKVEDDWGYSYDYSDKTLDEFKKSLSIIKKAEIYIQRIDWLISCDDGEETFHERLKEDLDENKIK